VFVRGLPERFTRQELVEVLDATGLHSSYDFIYLPLHFKRLVTFGYAIVNFRSHESAADAMKRLGCVHVHDQLLRVEWSEGAQGLEALVQKYRHRSVMQSGKHDSFKPAMFNSLGVQVPFPQMPGRCETATHAKPGAKKPLPLVSRTTRQARTTVVFRELPQHMSRSDVLWLLDDAGFAGYYDFVYLPLDFARGVCRRYAIVNFIEPSKAREALSRKFSVFGISVAVEWSHSHQGLHSLVARYRGSAIMDSEIHDSCKPIVLSNGVHVPFPGFAA